ncbi:MAG: hypothetical protein NC908_00380 [Candidatus Omnitrophica bacterium]|nr:hypothetical protein [Candidatus Omnitrophota bacterium]
MTDRIEKIIRFIYRRWKSEKMAREVLHPDEETLVCFVENRLSPGEAEQVKQHLINCQDCAESVALQINLASGQQIDIPEGILELAKKILVKPTEEKTVILEIFLRLKEKMLELISTTGDVLWGQELLPAPVLRSRHIKDFKDEIAILKDLGDMTLEAKVESKGKGEFSLMLTTREKQTQKEIRDLRVTLIKDNIELESYLTDAGKVVFEHVLIGRYTIDIFSLERKIASVLLDIKV